MEPDVATQSKDFQRFIVEPTLEKLSAFDPRMNSPASVKQAMGILGTGIGAYQSFNR